MAGNKNSGRKPKTDEQKLIEKLSPLEPKIFKALEKGIEENNFRCIQLAMAYLYGKPTYKTNIAISNFENEPIQLIKFIKTDAQN